MDSKKIKKTFISVLALLFASIILMTAQTNAQSSTEKENPLLAQADQDANQSENETSAESTDLSNVDWDAEPEESSEGADSEDLSNIDWDAEPEEAGDGDLSNTDWDAVPEEGLEESEVSPGISIDYGTSVEVEEERFSPAQIHFYGVLALFGYLAGMFFTVYLSSKLRLYRIVPHELLILLHSVWPLELLVMLFLRDKSLKAVQQ